MKLIIESPILQEANIVYEKNNKAVWRQVMQSSDEKNQNNRVYPKNLLDEGMNNCKGRIQGRSFWGELDHPLLTGDRQVDMNRQSQVLLKEVSHLIRGYEWNGNKLVGELETVDTPNGKILLGLLRDKCRAGLSLRGLASLKRIGDYNQVEGPLTVISYDAVSVPSHKGAVVDFNEMKFESKMLMESVMKDNSLIYRDTLRESKCGNTICVNGVCYLSEYFDKLVETKSIKFFDKWI